MREGDRMTASGRSAATSRAPVLALGFGMPVITGMHMMRRACHIQNSTESATSEKDGLALGGPGSQKFARELLNNCSGVDASRSLAPSNSGQKVAEERPRKAPCFTLCPSEYIMKLPACEARSDRSQRATSTRLRCVSPLIGQAADIEHPAAKTPRGIF